MSELTILTPSEQVAAYLRGELLRGRWSETMPGVRALAPELGVDPKTAGVALSLLEKEGLLVGQGPGRRRLIKLPVGLAPPTLRVGILTYKPLELTEGYVSEAQLLLTEAGHRAFFSAKSLTELGMNVTRIARHVKLNEADAWVVAAASREVLEWFSAQAAPAFALFGRRRGLPIAGVGPDKPPIYATATRRLVELGHHRIVLLTPRERRRPQPGTSERALLAELEAGGILTGSFNLPDWEESVEGLQGLLDSLFGLTPPTAMIVDEAHFFAATQQYLAARGLRVPQDVSLICTNGDPTFEWCKPSIAHIRWDSHAVVRRIVRWANNVACGKDDKRQTETKAEFVEGGTIGPVSGKR